MGLHFQVTGDYYLMQRPQQQQHVAAMPRVKVEKQSTFVQVLAISAVLCAHLITLGLPFWIRSLHLLQSLCPKERGWGSMGEIAGGGRVCAALVGGGRVGIPLDEPLTKVSSLN